MMPLEFGATDWCLLIDFDQGKVSAIRMRTSDGIQRKPEAAPDDKMSDSSPTPGRDGEIGDSEAVGKVTH
jgi:hypothetical protein